MNQRIISVILFPLAGKFSSVVEVVAGYGFFVEWFHKDVAVEPREEQNSFSPVQLLRVHFESFRCANSM